ncbi:MAG: Nif3-like dinuclear metal center hexameric protein [Burkholderiaceae bacterium]|nr:Nif3-like dinuclear metal center hexameric protein [Burkholderiaceae bacterium]
MRYTERNTLLATFDNWLQPDRFKDYGPNGLQVEGKSRVARLVSGVTASLALIEAAIEWEADAIVVHHGLFWRGYDGRVVGWMKRRLALLLAHDVNLFAYHLPLDGHGEWGNNAQLGRVLGLDAHSRFGDQDLGFLGERSGHGFFRDARELASTVTASLGRQVVCVEGDGRPIRRLAWCSGGAQGYFESAIAAGADAFITGEISEPQAHLARETGIAFLACGHHASERYGAPAIAAEAARQLGISHRFIDIENPA